MCYLVVVDYAGCKFILIVIEVHTCSTVTSQNKPRFSSVAEDKWLGTVRFPPFAQRTSHIAEFFNDAIIEFVTGNVQRNQSGG
ncbi:hypothetical protein Pla52n_00840 [Stieleria varia]|uniref:Uncharacterized protein n=1 Tax=Stieleria varia TaxID=2528005 RepID=A0A5C6B7W5_9BACT|nr:hypothetical protein Pla52n_00840 [Stieleria varia]